MIKNYFVVAWRNLKKKKVFSFINIFGLAIGLTCCILISFYIVHETSYDKHHKNGDRIFQIGTVFINEGVEEPGANSAGALAKMLQQEYQEVKQAARLLNL